MNDDIKAGPETYVNGRSDRDAPLQSGSQQTETLHDRASTPPGAEAMPKTCTTQASGTGDASASQTKPSTKKHTIIGGVIGHLLTGDLGAGVAGGAVLGHKYSKHSQKKNLQG